MNKYLSTIFGLDLRSLALFRIAISLVILIDLATRAASLQDHYTDLGILPAGYLKTFYPLSISIHALSGSIEVQMLLFTITAFFALMLLVGYKTTTAIFISWFMCLFLKNRNPWVKTAGDQLLVMLLFWGIFLPLGARFSIDSLRRKSEKSFNQEFSVASVIFILQMHIVYFFTSIYKFNSAWIWDGTAIGYVMQNFSYLSPIGVLMSKYLSGTFRYLTNAVYLIELIGFYFLYSPLKTGLVRTIAIFIFIFMHLGIGLAMYSYLGVFSPIVIAGFLALLPAFFWEFIEAVFKRIKIKKYFFALRTSIIRNIKKVKLYLEGNPKKNEKIKNHKFEFLFDLIKSNFLIWCFLYVVYVNIVGLIGPNIFWLPYTVERIGTLLGLNQRWNMFNEPLTEVKWLVAPGLLKNGHYKDLIFWGENVSYENPLVLNRYYKDGRWAKFLSDLPIIDPTRDARYRLLAEYFCRKWNTNHSDQEALLHLNIYLMSQKIDLSNPNSDIKKEEIFKWTCSN